MADEVIKTVEETFEHVCGKTYPIVVTRLRSKSPFEFEFEGETYLVDAVTITDSGKYGTSTIFTIHRDYTEEERRAGRELIQKTIADVMKRCKLW